MYVFDKERFVCVITALWGPNGLLPTFLFLLWKKYCSGRSKILFYPDTVLLQVSLCCTLQFATKTFSTLTCLILFVSSITRKNSVTFISKTKVPDSDTSSNCKNVVLCYTPRFSVWTDSVFCLRGTVVESQTNYIYKPIPSKLENIFYERLPAIMLMSWGECFLTQSRFCFVNNCHLWNPQPLMFVLWYPDFVCLFRYLTKNV